MYKRASGSTDTLAVIEQAFNHYYSTISHAISVKTEKLSLAQHHHNLVPSQENAKAIQSAFEESKNIGNFKQHLDNIATLKNIRDNIQKFNISTDNFKDIINQITSTHNDIKTSAKTLVIDNENSKFTSLNQHLADMDSKTSPSKAILTYCIKALDDIYTRLITSQKLSEMIDAINLLNETSFEKELDAMFDQNEKKHKKVLVLFYLPKNNGALSQPDDLMDRSPVNIVSPVGRDEMMFTPSPRG